MNLHRSTDTPFRYFSAIMSVGFVVAVATLLLVLQLPRHLIWLNAIGGAMLEVVLMLIPVNYFLLKPMNQYLKEREERTCALASASQQLEYSLEIVEQTHRKSRLLSELIEFLQASRNTSEAEEMLRRSGHTLFPAAGGAIYIYRSSRNLIEKTAFWGEQASLPDLFPPEDCWALRRGQLHASGHEQTNPLCRHLTTLPQGSAALCVPMMAHGETVGVLVLPGLCSESESFETIRRAAQSASEQIALALANLRLREKLRDQAIRDPLTGLFNRRYFEETINRELYRAEQEGRSTGLILIDIDHFKRLNDCNGHEAGDIALRRFSLLIQRHAGPEDIVCRHGGEEFIVLVPNVSLESVVARANQIREAVKDMELIYRGDSVGNLTISCGVAVAPFHGRSYADLTEAAYKALYLAKHAGRDRVLSA